MSNTRALFLIGSGLFLVLSRFFPILGDAAFWVAVICLIGIGFGELI